MPDKILISRSVHHLLAWLLALVLPLQGMAVGVFTAMGPAHIHEPADAHWVLTDFRRWKPSPVSEGVIEPLSRVGAKSPGAPCVDPDCRRCVRQQARPDQMSMPAQRSSRPVSNSGSPMIPE